MTNTAKQPIPLIQLPKKSKTANTYDLKDHMGWPSDSMEYLVFTQPFHHVGKFKRKLKIFVKFIQGFWCSQHVGLISKTGTGDLVVSDHLDTFLVDFGPYWTYWTNVDKL